MDELELTINFKKIVDIIKHRKITIIIIYALIISITVIITLSLPKKYVTNAVLLINKSSYTNLTEINPFIVSDLAGKGAGDLLFGGSSLENEIAIIKSEKVLLPVIKQNNLKYEKGDKSGQYISMEKFIKELDITNPKGSNTLTLSYKSNDPQKSFNIIKSIINNYIETYEGINTNKSVKDREFLEKAYLIAKKDIEKKIYKMKSSESATTVPDTTVDMKLIILGQLDKRMNNNIRNIPHSAIDNKKNLMDLEGEFKKLSFIKEKYEWSLLVEKMSDNATNVMVLNKPLKPDKEDFVEPSMLLNVIIGLFFSFSLSLLILLFKENNDKNLSYSDLDNDYVNYKKLDNSMLLSLITNILTEQVQAVSVISFANEVATDQFLSILRENIKNKNIEVKLVRNNSTIQDYINALENIKIVILLSEIDETKKHIYSNIKSIVKQKDYIKLFEFIKI